jgi:hypothetical protein
MGQMKVIICGAGQVGWQIARHLSGENNDVTVVDNNPDLVRRATDTLDVQGLTGFASHPDVLDTRRRARCRHDHRRDLLRRGQHGHLPGGAFGLFRAAQDRAAAQPQSYLDAIYSDLYRRDHLPIDVVISPEKEVAEAALQPHRLALDLRHRDVPVGRRADAGHRARRGLPGAEHAAAPVVRAVLDAARHRRRRPARGHALRAGTGRPAVRGRPDLRLHPHEDVPARWRSSARPAKAPERVIDHRRRQCGPWPWRARWKVRQHRIRSRVIEPTAAAPRWPPTRWSGPSCCMATGSTWSFCARPGSSAPMPSCASPMTTRRTCWPRCGRNRPGRTWPSRWSTIPRWCR